jgi:hypothetical protein
MCEKQRPNIDYDISNAPYLETIIASGVNLSYHCRRSVAIVLLVL